ncbi:YiiX/YebB-like N1pC/P60 family cysteine hydrolase [Leptospira santarosai]|uniref:YiiX/YebB-like N1pC/P60 family cysteine hydrolase n=1 Tax=Leptospira santarosai TaxID=28183 RepID=UPI000517EA6C|nr:YiiX/YebB-like N1pC/P60 family cysteine hydrolase [Leptospira santarosai]
MDHFNRKFRHTQLSGYVLNRSKGYFITHTGIFIGADESGTLWVVESQIPNGVRLVTLEDFCQGQKFTAVAPSLAQTEVVNRAISKIGTPYNPFYSNCQHFTNWAAYNKVESPDLKFLCTLSLIGLALVLKNNQRKY